MAFFGRLFSLPVFLFMQLIQLFLFFVYVIKYILPFSNSANPISFDRKSTKKLPSTVLNGGNGPSKLRQLTVIINPYSGSGKAQKIFESIQDRFVETPGLDVSVITTTCKGHAYKMCTQISQLDCDGIICVGGDGLIHEVINGLMARSDAAIARHIPIGVIPAGSGNGFAHSIGAHTPEEAVDIILNGIVHPLDIVAVTPVDNFSPQPQNFSEDSPHNFAVNRNRAIYSFLFVGWGMLSEMEKTRDHLRWFGDIGFNASAWLNILTTWSWGKYASHLSFIPANFQFNNQPENLENIESESSYSPEISTPSKNHTAITPPSSPDEDYFENEGNNHNNHNNTNNHHATFSPQKGKEKSANYENGTSFDYQNNSQTSHEITNSNNYYHENGRKKIPYVSPTRCQNSLNCKGCEQPHQISKGKKPQADLSDSVIVQGASQMHEDGGLFFLFGNLSHQAQNFTATPYAHLSDGFVDVVVVDSCQRLELLKILKQATPQNQKRNEIDPHIQYYKTKEVLFSIRQPSIPLDIDGELVSVRDLGSDTIMLQTLKGMCAVFCKHPVE
eukprot:TRINITY_DN5772_c0_g1_i1.p1 TRINITY_DN5772_c0_g1~~TRINITY_DN5772_c0_g1_i1.p1  ORF type:complete len:558 (-),score=127.63 TRINITY_DN5772_c0_g1_i1:87-1760(-)